MYVQIAFKNEHLTYFEKERSTNTAYYMYMVCTKVHPWLIRDLVTWYI